ncbi:unnamed protein product [Hyaloperonospora brassicae]|uniref:Uncharacterized protein n=1 Tax=Hyaloperonospora brassicae TaxID=162125 RepID=A0AAV0U4Q2_HYABA|nr:unnamed protein product [Hyaloperonospora brassicae]
MQENDLSANREVVLAKANDICRAKYGYQASSERSSIDGQREFFSEYMKHIIECNASLDRLFNMDETRFSQKSRQTKVTLVKGSQNV